MAQTLKAQLAAAAKRAATAESGRQRAEAKAPASRGEGRPLAEAKAAR